jgi:hypothetical protein
MRAEVSGMAAQDAPAERGQCAGSRAAVPLLTRLGEIDQTEAPGQLGLGLGGWHVAT